MNTQIFAHRGAKGLVKHENTLEAFQKAIEINADGIELDVRKTKDNILIIIHDNIINNLLINHLSYCEVLNESKKLGFIVPTLKEVLLLCKGKIFLDIEIKAYGTEKEIIDLVLQYLDYHEFALRCFDIETVKNIKIIDPKIYSILLLGNNQRKNFLKNRFNDIFFKKNAKYANCNEISPYYKLLFFNYVKRAKKIGLNVSTWTVNTKKDLKKVIFKKHVDKVITNHPDLAIEVLKEGQIK